MKKAIIVGATSGIGKELALQLASQGYLVGIAGRRTELLHALKAQHPEAFFIETIDITETTTVPEKLNALVVALGGCDLLVISSGTGHINDTLQYDLEKNTIDTNVSGFTCVADWAYRYFAEQGHGHLVGITSVGGLRGSRSAPAYNAGKAYQINYLEGLRQKAFRSGKPIYITDIRPGLVDTDMAKGEGLFWVMPVEKALRQILRAIRHRKSVAVVTRRWRLVALIMKGLPGALYNRL